MAEPLFTQVAVLLHLNGADGSTTFTDSSSHAHTFSVGGGTPSISTAQSKFGGASGRFDTDYITAPNDASFLLGADLFTIEYFVRLDSIATSQAIGANGKFQDDLYDWIVQHFAVPQTLAWRSSVVSVDIVFGPSSVMSANTWHHFAVSRFDIGGGQHKIRVFIDGAYNPANDKTISSSLDLSPAGTYDLNIGGYPATGIGMVGYLDEIRISIGTAVYTDTFTPPAAPFDDGVASALAVADGPLQSPSVAIATVTIPQLLVSDGGMPPSQSHAVAYTPAAALAEVLGPLGSPQLLSMHDFTGQLNEAAPSFYVMDLVTPAGLVRAPISSWQATLQTDVQCYVQCVVPAATDWVPDIEAATEFVITRRGTLIDGSAIEYEMARAPAQTVSLDGGAFNYTATISGYTAALPVVENPPTAMDRTLAGVRTASRNSGTVRVRCNIDWLLRPGHRAYLNEEAIVVRYVNFYVPSGDQYMDVGDRAS